MKRLSVALLCSAIACVVLPASGARAFCWPWEHDFTGSSGYTRTRHPIVLAHGALGFESMSVLGIDLLDYWYDLDSALADCGGASVHVAHVSPSNSTEYRGEQLLAQIQLVLAQTGARKVNLIGHSMGGLDARYVMAVRPDLVASVTTIGSPHKGGEVFQALASGVTPELSPLNWMADGVSAAVRLVWGLLGAPAGDVDTTRTLQALHPGNAARWNERYTAGLPPTACGEGAASWNGIPLFSWTGDSAAPWTTSLNPLIAMDAMMNGLFAAIDALSREPTDGLISVCSTHFGDVLRDDYDWNHVDEVNLLWGLTADFEVDPRTEFRKHANRLKNRGL
jgi:triacylglycerol lipase